MHASETTDAQALVKAAQRLVLHQDIDALVDAVEAAMAKDAARKGKKLKPGKKKFQGMAAKGRKSAEAVARDALIKQAGKAIVILKRGNAMEKAAAESWLKKIIPQLARFGSLVARGTGGALKGIGSGAGKIGLEGLGKQLGRAGTAVSGITGTGAGTRAAGLGALLAGTGLLGAGAGLGRLSKGAPQQQEEG